MEPNFQTTTMLLLPGHIGDHTKRRVYFWANGHCRMMLQLTEQPKNIKRIGALNAGNFSGAALTAGIMSHYIADVGCFRHVMGANTDWGAETGNNHSNYESL